MTVPNATDAHNTVMLYKLLLERVSREVIWMARRYADGRRTYATAMLNDVVRQFQAHGFVIHTPDETPWARDGDGMDGLTHAERMLGRPVDEWLRTDKDRTDLKIEKLERRLAQANAIALAVNTFLGPPFTASHRIDCTTEEGQCDCGLTAMLNAVRAYNKKEDFHGDR